MLSHALVELVTEKIFLGRCWTVVRNSENDETHKNMQQEKAFGSILKMAYFESRSPLKSECRFRLSCDSSKVVSGCDLSKVLPEIRLRDTSYDHLTLHAENEPRTSAECVHSL